MFKEENIQSPLRIRRMCEVNAFITFIRIYSLIEDEGLGAKIKLILHKALIISVITYAFPTWD
jgi:hypothetical protein